jgi:hypothetical protein
MQPVYDEMPLEDLLFDPENPRFLRRLDGHDAEQVLRFMLEDAGPCPLRARLIGNIRSITVTWRALDQT